jgi:hypothetical protein
MSIRSVPSYFVICDDCQQISTEEDEYSGYSDPASARDAAAENFDWHDTHNLDLCLDCWTKRTCDECGELDCAEHPGSAS